MPIFAFALITVLVYAILAKTKILGSSGGINFLLSAILAIIFISFTGVREYLTNITPWFAVLLTLCFFLFLIIAFLLKTDDWTKFTKPIAIVFIILLVLVAIIAVFYTFPSTQALLPGKLGTSDSCENSDYDYFDEEDCYKRGDEWKCREYSRTYYYDKCRLINDDEYRCYDDNYDRDCEYRDSYDNNDLFEKAGNWFYRDKITNAFWLILITVIVGIIITRKIA